MQKILSRFFIFTLAVCLATFGTVSLKTLAAAPTILLSAYSGPPGTPVTITANNTSFTPVELVTILYDVPAQTWTTTANTDGGLNPFQISIPHSRIGAHVINVTGGTSANSANVSFTVTPQIIINPSSGPVGSSTTITGSGFGVSEALSLSYDGVPVISAGANVNGDWSASLTIPASASGSRTVTATGATSGTMTTYFTVTPSISIAPANAAPGASVTVTGSGFAASETGITITYDGDPMVTNPPSPAANAKGGWSASFIVPASPSGAHSIDASGLTTPATNVQEKTFTISAGILINPASGVPGTEVTVTGAGFKPGETGITVTFDTQTISSSTQATPEGDWSIKFKIPTAAGGAHKIGAGSPATPASSIAEQTFTVTPGLSISNNSAPPGSTITVTGTGFGLGEGGITISYDGVAVTASNIKADASGSWKSTLVIPASPAGSHTIGAAGSTSMTVPGVSFTVTASITISKPNAAPGSSVTITGAGFGAGETGITVSYDGAPVVTTPPSPSADSNGSWSASFTIPASAAGTHNISAKGSITQETSLTDKGINVAAGISIDQTTGYVGDSIVITGSGFAANSPLTFAYDNREIVVGSATTDESGSFNRQLVIPPSAAGDHIIKVTDGQKNSKTVTFTMESTPPPTPGQVSPTDGTRLGITGDITPTLTWSKVTDPSGVTYSLQIDTDPDFPHPLLDKSGITGTHYTLTSSEKLARGDYFWRVKAVDGASNESQWSPAWELKSGVMSMATLIIIILVLLGLAGTAAYLLLQRRRPQRGWEGARIPEPEPPKPIPAQWRLIEPGEASSERPLPYRLALPQAPKGEKGMSTGDMARLKVIVDFAQSLPLIEPGYTSKWLLDMAQTSLGTDNSPVVYEQILDNELQVRYEPAWMRHPIFQDLLGLLEGQPILEELNVFMDAVNRCAAESTLLLQQIYSESRAENPADFLAKGGWEFISAIYSDALRWFLGKSLQDPSERDYVLKRPNESSEGMGAVELWGEQSTSFAERLIQAADEAEAVRLRTLHLKLRRSYRGSDTVKQFVDMMTQMAVQRDRLSSSFSQLNNLVR